VEKIEKGNAVVVAGSGPAAKERMRLYRRYELLFHLRCLVHNDNLFEALARLAVLMPFKRLASRVVRLLTALVREDLRYFNFLKYAFVEKYIP